MKILLKILNYFFTTLGVIFFIILLFVLYLFVVDPFNIKPLFRSFGVSPSVIMDISQDKTVNVPADKTVDKNVLLNSEQEKALESIGVDPSVLPTEVTPELEKCLIDKVGAKRAEEISKGSEPTAMDFLKASACLR